MEITTELYAVVALLSLYGFCQVLRVQTAFCCVDVHTTILESPTPHVSTAHCTPGRGLNTPTVPPYLRGQRTADRENGNLGAVAP